MIGLIGGKGRIGKRYQAVLRFLDLPFKIYDLGDSLPGDGTEIDRAIIATPTETHFELAKEFAQKEIPFLLEKPPTKILKEALELSELSCQGFIVNNYHFLSENIWWPERVKSITYDFYHSGPDGLAWDMAQLIWIAKLHGATISAKQNLPFWSLTINEEFVHYQELENTYLQMIRAFAQNETKKLWPLSMAFPMVKAVLEVDSTQGDSFFHEF